MMHPNEQTIREGYDAFARGDLETVRERFHDDIEWTVPGRSPLAGTYRGIDEVFGFFGKLFQLTGGTFRVEVLDACANDERAFVCTKTTGTIGERTLENLGMALYGFRDGKVVSARFFNEDQYSADEAFAAGAELSDVITQESKVEAET